MKIQRVVSILFLAATATAQTGPVRLNVTPQHVMATNVSPKEIVFINVGVSSKYGQTQSNPDFNGSHDFYFKPGGFAPGDIVEVIHEYPVESTTYTKAKVLFIQFADGSTWGDPHTPGVERAIAERQPMLELYDKAMLSYQSQGETAFLDYLGNIPQQAILPRARARIILRIQKDSGTDAAIAYIQLRLNAGKARHF